MKRPAPYIHTRTTLLALAWLALSACTSVPTTQLAGVRVVAEVGANQNTGTALDIVFVYDTDANKKMPQTGPEWFAQKNAIKNGAGNKIDIISLEPTPHNIVDVVLPSRASKAIGVYSYANYINPNGQSLGNLTPFKTMTIWLTPTTIVYVGN